MSEKRFEFYSDDYLIGVLDNVTGKTLNHFATIDLLNEQQATIIKQDEEIKRLEKMIWKIQWRFQQEVGIEKAKEHYQEIDKEMED